jgi:CTP synthase
MLQPQGLDDIVVRQAAPRRAARRSLRVAGAWSRPRRNPTGDGHVAMVGKYVHFRDSYISLNEALMHAGIHTRTRVQDPLRRGQEIERDGHGAAEGMDAVLVPGGFGERGIEGKIAAARWRASRACPISGSASGCRSR